MTTGIIFTTEEELKTELKKEWKLFRKSQRQILNLSLELKVLHNYTSEQIADCFGESR